MNVWAWKCALQLEVGSVLYSDVTCHSSTNVILVPYTSALEVKSVVRTTNPQLQIRNGRLCLTLTLVNIYNDNKTTINKTQKQLIIKNKELHEFTSYHISWNKTACAVELRSTENAGCATKLQEMKIEGTELQCGPRITAPEHTNFTHPVFYMWTASNQLIDSVSTACGHSEWEWWWCPSSYVDSWCDELSNYNKTHNTAAITVFMHNRIHVNQKTLWWTMVHVLHLQSTREPKVIKPEICEKINSMFCLRNQML